VYESLPGLSFADGFQYYANSLGTSEPVYYLLAWIASHLIPKDLFVAFSNSILAFVAVRLFMQWNAHPLLAVVLVCSNYYFLVLYLSAERLKYAMLFLGLAILARRASRFYVFIALALLAHVQVILLGVGPMADRAIQFVRRQRRAWIVLGTVLFALPIWLLREHVEMKILSGYRADVEMADLARIAIFMVLSLVFSKDAKQSNQIIAIFIPLVVAVLLVGGDRINFLGYFVFLRYALASRQGFNLPTLLTAAYFTLQSYDFVERIWLHGTGYMIDQ
jgi:hypothetical protein